MKNVEGLSTESDSKILHVINRTVPLYVFAKLINEPEHWERRSMVLRQLFTWRVVEMNPNGLKF